MGKGRKNDYLSYLDDPATTNEILVGLANSNDVDRINGQYFLRKLDVDSDLEDHRIRFVRDIKRDKKIFQFNGNIINPENYETIGALNTFIRSTYNLTDETITTAVVEKLLKGWNQNLPAGYLISALTGLPFEYQGPCIIAKLDHDRLSNLTITLEGDLKIETMITLFVKAELPVDGKSGETVFTIPGYIYAVTECKKDDPSFRSGAVFFSNSILENIYQYGLANLYIDRNNKDKVTALIQAAEQEETKAAAAYATIIQKNIANKPFTSAMATIKALDKHKLKSHIINLMITIIAYPLNGIYLLQLDKIIEKNPKDNVLVTSLRTFKENIETFTKPYQDAYKELKTEIDCSDPKIKTLAQNVLLACDKFANNPSPHFPLSFLTKTLSVTKNLLLDPSNQIKSYQKHIEKIRRKSNATQLVGAMKCLAAGLFIAASVVVAVGSLGTFAGPASVGLAIAGGLLVSGINDIRQGRKQIKEIDQLAKPVGLFIKTSTEKSNTVTKTSIFATPSQRDTQSPASEPNWRFNHTTDDSSDSEVTQETTTEDDMAIPPRNRRK